MPIRLSPVGRSPADRVRIRARTKRRRLPCAVEELENRVLLSGGPTVYTVDSTTATGTGSGNSGDLVYAIDQANANTNPAGSVIEFDPTIFNSSTLPTITLDVTLFLVEKGGPVVIDGPGANAVTISASKTDGEWVFHVVSGVAAAFSGLTMANAGGGIDNEGGTVAVSGCTIANNNAGIANDAGTVAVSDCTIANNTEGGGIGNNGTLTVTNSTIANNNSGIFGGGIDNNSGNTTIVNCTIADNTSFTGAGIWINSGTVALNNSIVVLNHDTQGLGGPENDNISGSSVTPTSADNVVGTGTYGGLKNHVDGNRVDVADPGLGPLGEHGGPTETIALLRGSPAIDAGSVALAVDPTSGLPLATDERGPGFARVVKGTVDAGAFELCATFASATSPAPTITGERVVDAGRGSHAHVAGFELTFSQALEAARARNVANYIVTQTLEQAGQTVTQRVKIKVQYNSATHAARLMLHGRPSFALGGQIVVNGSAPNGVTDTSGTYLDGSADGVAGSNAVFDILPGGGGAAL